MPIYEYQCQSCGHQFEVLQKISAQPPAECPACHESTLKKMVSAAAFKLKGGGWYETDFKNSGKQKSEVDRKEGAAKPGGDSGGDKSSKGSAEGSSSGGNSASKTASAS